MSSEACIDGIEQITSNIKQLKENYQKELCISEVAFVLNSDLIL